MGGAKGEEKPPGGAEDWCYHFGNKGAFDLKAPKKSPIALRMVVLAVTMLCGGLVANHAEIADYFNRRGVSAIFLFRRNLLRQLISQLANNHDRYLKQLNGTHKAHVHTRDEANILAKYKPRLNTTSLISSLKQADEYTRDALQNLKSIHHITIYYEDLISNRTRLLDVLDFLKVPRRKLVSRHVKIHTRPLSEQIENWDEVYNALNGTQYESFLNADYRI
ncbi:hypothetical protein PR202_gn00339 [Eleusine coracana subsp. coracana]|uniref:Sulfotransferase n=1 Tax=Eleusine coracana subsp. coracana TaxID=191504 RepID=A0AAV5FZF9_ELECO|nr:hypothetical protein PR202_gn00339 [Eleusine coracana subsp. coracana]